jgi:general stress protein YciG
MNDNETPKSRKGFASMTPERNREIAAKGGKRAHELGVAHQFDADEAAAAGRKGGVSVSRNREHMREIGRKGGLARQKAAAAKRALDAETFELAKRGGV